MDIVILYDNKTCSSKMHSGWGFSCLINHRVLFDTGEDGGSLLANMKEKKVDISSIKEIVISHDHWDHIGGIEAVLKQKPNIKVYACSGFSEEFKSKVKQLRGKLVEVEGFVEIIDNIFTTGTIKGKHRGKDIDEQALVIKTEKGITVVTGCAHPGIIKIIELVKQTFSEEDVYCVIGGFHLNNTSTDEVLAVIKTMKDLGINKIGPCHCCGEEAIGLFKENLGENFIEISAGKEKQV